tara:strand:- start:338 stop:814 length:477 start_codon:yes stop_codon:yes gene_type:complete
MGTRGNMWVKDSQNADIIGKCRIKGREDSIEVLSMGHRITIPADVKTGKLTGNRTHDPMTIIKEIDQSTPFFNKACCSGECLKEVKICLYQIDNHGKEAAYFQYMLSNARVIAVQPLIGGTEQNHSSDKEKIALIYEKINWEHLDGNYSYSDTWAERD